MLCTTSTSADFLIHNNTTQVKWFISIAVAGSGYFREMSTQLRLQQMLYKVHQPDFPGGLHWLRHAETEQYHWWGRDQGPAPLGYTIWPWLQCSPSPLSIPLTPPAQLFRSDQPILQKFSIILSVAEVQDFDFDTSTWILLSTPAKFYLDRILVQHWSHYNSHATICLFLHLKESGMVVFNYSEKILVILSHGGDRTLWIFYIFYMIQLFEWQIMQQQRRADRRGIPEKRRWLEYGTVWQRWNLFETHFPWIR